MPVSPDWIITEETVAGLVAAGRARWKVENENNNVLKTEGYYLEQNFGHGKQHLSSLLVRMNISAFGLHTFLSLTDESSKLVRASLERRRTFFQHVRTLTHSLRFETWEKLMEFMMKGLEIGSYAQKT
jgi:hypothetical protein